MKIKDGFVLRSVAGENIVVPVGSNSISFKGIITVNSTGAFLWKELVEGISLEALSKKLADTYNISEQNAQKDTAAFIEKLKSSDLLADE